jgi:hypothetical protein
MQVHLPKAFHGWRELAKEVGIIVLGVLIALSFEQLVQEWRWREQVRTTRQALISEIEYSAIFAEERLAIQQCLRDRITSLTTKLNSDAAIWTADPMVLGQPRHPLGGSFMTFAIPLAYRAPHRPWITDEWEAAKSTGVVDHMDRDEVRNFEFIFRSIDELSSFQNEEASLEPQLSFLSFNQAMQPQARVEALVTLGRLDYLNAAQGQSARQLLGNITSRHLQLAPLSFGGAKTTFDAATRRILTALKERYGPCVIDPPEK